MNRVDATFLPLSAALSGGEGRGEVVLFLDRPRAAGAFFAKFPGRFLRDSKLVFILFLLGIQHFLQPLSHEVERQHREHNRNPGHNYYMRCSDEITLPF